jgi:SAM-dependent methyltransferase
VDLRLPSSDPLPAALAALGWFSGTTDGDVVCSRLLDPVWRRAVPSAAFEPHAATPTRKTLRRASTVLAEGRVIDAARNLMGEARGFVRSGKAASAPRTEAVAGGPAGSGPFVATRYRTIGRAFDLVPDSLRSTRLLDVGAGDGRVLVEARRLGFARGIGWEIDPQLVAFGNERVRPWGVLDAVDATATPVPDDVGVVYLFHPFDVGALGRFAVHLGDSIRRAPRPLLVLYVNPRALAPLEDAGLVVVEANPDFVVLATQAPRRN